MGKRIGEQSVVIGAGIAGLATASVLAGYFDRVTIVERDALPDSSEQRRSVPQGKHLHVLLAGGLHALKELFPGFEEDLINHEAVRMQEGLDVLRETPFGIPFPKVDAGFHRYAQSRPLLEMLIRNRVKSIENVKFLTGRSVKRLLAGEDGKSVAGVTVEERGGEEQSLAAELVMDCGGSGGNLTLQFLESTGHPLPEEERIEINVGYSTLVMDIPEDAPKDWKGLMILPKAPTSSRGCIIMPLEGGKQWIVTITGIGDEIPPRELGQLMEFVSGLSTPTAHKLLKDANFHGPVESSRFKYDRLRHFEKLTSFPRGLVPVGDVICSLNPALGQGMSVALKEVVALSQVLAEQGGNQDPLEGLAMKYFAALPDILEGPWMSVSIADLSYPTTIGVRTKEMETNRQIIGVLSTMLLKDAELLKLEAEIRNLIKPFRAIRESGVWQRAVEVLRSNKALVAK
ncbi:MAG TPA: FAD-dependent monooxygenase [Pyrinomonadaceae bacterium]|jgi:2-polyprenyl-6-methoxyphenol hydroxylase-like FAD-dependent oxidoreductase